ncbi:hypothetical protein HMPREF0682_1096 [Propionibacterium acidifaciens F0233]|uniref:Uncharacterized protein n=1 Tax=Propionibacterium acidifaciens F0233 TaxID=553198 RepID=U2SDC8_9ACTN|nr:hypothetical protein HMPREF0682_1096 [Propionibacterium acidifaciens F0233]
MVHWSADGHSRRDRIRPQNPIPKINETLNSRTMDEESSDHIQGLA